MHDFQKNPRRQAAARRHLPAARPQAGGCRDESPCGPVCHPISLVLPKETGVAPPKKNAFGACRRRGLSFKALRMSRVVIPSSNGCSAPPTVRCFASLAALRFAETPGGKGAEPPNNLPDKQPPLQTPQTTPRGRAPPARRISLAPPRPPARAAYYRPILPRKMGHFRKVR